MPTPPSRGAVSSPYGMRINPNDGKYRMHYGEDTLGVGNFSPVNGTVVFSGWDSTGTGLGYAVGVRESANPSVIWWIAHHASLAVHVGQTVSEGLTKLGEKGATGAAKGVHCHTERRVGGAARPGSGTPTNPRVYYTNTAGGDIEPITIPGDIEMRILYNLDDNNDNTRRAIIGETSFQVITGPQSTRERKFWGDPVNVTQGEWDAARDLVLARRAASSSSGPGSLTTAQNDALMGLPAAIDDLPTKGELGQALTSTVALVNEHADDNKGEVIQAIDGIPGGSGSSNYDLTLNIDSVPGTATGTATPQ